MIIFTRKPLTMNNHNDEKVNSLEETISSENNQETIKKLEDHIVTLKKENDELLNAKKYLLADMSNMQRKTTKEIEDKVNRAHIKTIEAFLNVFDDFERLLQSADAQKIVGLELVQKSFARTLNQLNVTEIDTTKEFDPSLHEAIGSAEHSGENNEHECAGNNKIVIVNVVKKGYLYKNVIVLRPAQVIISC